MMNGRTLQEAVLMMVPEAWQNDTNMSDEKKAFYCEIEWAAHSPDLNPPYFYLWRYLKDNVHGNNPQSIGELKAAITAKIREIPKGECVRVIDNLRDVCKCAFNAEDAIWSTFWKENNNSMQTDSDG